MNSQAGNHSFGHIRQDTVDVTLRNTADVHLHVRQTRPLDAVLQSKARVGKARWIHDQAVEAFVHSLVDAINRFTLDVGVEDFQLVSVVVSMAPQHSVEVGWRCGAIYLRLTPSEKCEIGALQ